MQKLKVKHLMSPDPISVGPEASLNEVFELMGFKEIRHMPIVDEAHHVIGIISDRDLHHEVLYAEKELLPQQLKELMSSMHVDQIMHRSVETIGPDEDIAEAGMIMLQQKISSLPVVEGDQLIGILTEADFVKYVIDHLGIVSDAA